MFSTFFSLGLALMPMVAAKDIHVQVGGAEGQLVFDPQATFADVGDNAIFHFHPKNHSVTQSSFPDPCGKLPGGIDSGFMPVSGNETKTFTIEVKDTKPIWVNCQQKANTPDSHCRAGMVFAINCGADGTPNSFTNFLKAAKESLNITAGGGSSAAAASSTWTAAYGGVTIPAPPSAPVVTQTVVLPSSTWVTTYSSYPNSPAPTPASPQGTVHRVYVGGPGKLVFDPPHISALPRDTVVFEFRQKNHTVTQSSFADPCRMMNGSVVDSGFMPVADNATTFPTYNITVNDTAPFWAYCRQKTPVSHCGSGMVFAINSDEKSERNFTAFVELAKRLNGTSAAVSTPPPSNGASSLRVGGILTLGLGALIACML